jgi:2-haloacid dehalogenase
MLGRVDSPGRWATFDCYGTLVDWNAGIRSELGRLLGAEREEELLARYHQVEPEVQDADPEAPYREVMARVLERLAGEAGAELPAHERDALGRSLPGWPVFEEVPDALREAHDRGWTLVALSNSDRDLIESSLRAIGAPFEGAVVAGDIGSYKPAHGHWEEFYASYPVDRDRHVHVAQSHFHDIAPAHELGIPSIWINRLGERHEPAPTREQPDLRGLADTLEALVPGP